MHETDNRAVSDPGDETEQPDQPDQPERAADPTPDNPPAPTPPDTPALRTPGPTEGRLNLLAVASVVLSVAYFAIGISLGLMGLTAPIVLPALLIAALGAGYVARGQIWRNRERGRLLASLGVTLSYVGLALIVFGWALTLLTLR